MRRYQYAKWDGTQEPFPLDAEDIIGHLSDLFLDTSDFSWALSMMMRKGIADEEGQKMVLGINDLLRQIKNLRHQFLSRFSSTKTFDPLHHQLDHLLTSEPEYLEEMLKSTSRPKGEAGLESLPDKLSEALKLLLHISFPRQGTEDELSQLLSEQEKVAALEEFFHDHTFKGEEHLSYPMAWQLKELFQHLEQLEKVLENVRWGGNIEEVDGEMVGKVLGQEASRAVQQWKQIARLLEEAGFVAREDGNIHLTPKGIRRVGQKALKDILSALKKDPLGQHPLNLRGAGGFEIEDTKRYEYGDPFHLDLSKTLMNSLNSRRHSFHALSSLEASKLKIELKPEDFEVHHMQHLTQSSTVLMLDMSWSMAWFNRFFASKKVALALYHLIKKQFPKDNLFIVGFYSTAQELTAEELPFAQLCAGTYGTNMLAGLRVSGRLLAREKALNKQIIMITDGEPTAHFEDGQLFFQYPPGEKTLYETLREVQRCTRQKITINIFMLSSDYYLAEFVNKITQINKGRAFYTTPENLGKYLLIDYISGKRKQIV